MQGPSRPITAFAACISADQIPFGNCDRTAKPVRLAVGAGLHLLSLT